MSPSNTMLSPPINDIQRYRADFKTYYSYICFSRTEVDTGGDLVFVKNGWLFGEGYEQPTPRFHPGLVTEVYLFGNRSVVTEEAGIAFDVEYTKGFATQEDAFVVGKQSNDLYFVFRSTVDTYGGFTGGATVTVMFARDWHNLCSFALNDTDLVTFTGTARPIHRTTRFTDVTISFSD